MATLPRRVGIVDFLNSRPLAWGLLSGTFGERYLPVCGSPARVADLLAAGEVDVGLIPSVEYLRIPGLGLLRSGCVASEKEVRSVLLVARVPFSEVRSLALDSSSRTSAELVGILLQERFGITPRTAPLEANLDQMLESHDAALIIGDPALQVDRQRYLTMDLASEWNALTGLPFVFAVWAVRREARDDRLERDFAASLAAGLNHLPEIVSRAAVELGLPEASLREYLGESLTYALGERELTGLRAFFDKVNERRKLPPVEIRFVGQ